jgi:hypothetical protein
MHKKYYDGENEKYGDNVKFIIFEYRDILSRCMEGRVLR